MIEVHLLGEIKVIEDGIEIRFPFKKAEALFAYLVTAQKVTREKLVTLFWPDLEETVAKKNLRNALYLVKGLFKGPIFELEGRQSVLLSQETLWSVDLWHWQSMPLQQLENTLMGDFYVKDAEFFMDWLMTTRESLREEMLTWLYSRLTANNDPQQRLKLLKTILYHDPYDEAAYRMVMRVHGEQGNLNKAVEVYKQLEALLKQELGIEPDYDTLMLYRQILDSKHKMSTAPSQLTSDPQKNQNYQGTSGTEAFFYGRESEQQDFLNQWQMVCQKGLSRVLGITGEAGAGKSYFVAHLSKETTAKPLIYSSLQAEKTFDMIALYPILEMLCQALEVSLEMIKEKTLRWFEKEAVAKHTVYDALFQAVLGQFHTPMMIVLDDFQWMDVASQRLLMGIILRNRKCPLMWILISRNDLQAQEASFSELLPIWQPIIIGRFSRKECHELLEAYSKGHEHASHLADHLYQESEGIALYLMQALEVATQEGDLSQASNLKIGIGIGQAHLRHRIRELTDQARHIASLCACFVSDVPYEEMVLISGLSEWELLAALRELVDHRILMEIDHGQGQGALFRFVHHKLKEVLVSGLLKAQLRIFHRRIAKMLLDKFADSGEMPHYAALIYHYQEAGDRLNELTYRLLYLSDYLQINHETFPILHVHYVGHPSVLVLSDARVDEALAKIDDLFENLILSPQMQSRAVVLRMHEALIKGRYGIKNGRYDQGLKWIDRLIQLAKEHEEPTFLFQGLLQRGFYEINRHDLVSLDQVVDEGLGYFEREKHYPYACFLRLKGLGLILRGDFAGGNHLVEEALEMTRSLKEPAQYALGVIACQYYLAESARLSGDFQRALAIDETVIKELKKLGMYGRLTVFYTHAGQTAFDVGEFELAGSYFKKALNLFTKYEYRFGRSVAIAYSSLCALYADDYCHKQIDDLYTAHDYAQKLHNPYELGLVLRAIVSFAVYLKKEGMPLSPIESLLAQVHTYVNAEAFNDLKHYCYQYDVANPILLGLNGLLDKI